MRHIVTKDMVRGRIATILRGLSPKAVASVIQGSERNIYNWRNEESEPSAYQLIRLMSEYDEIFEAVMFMAGRQDLQNNLSSKDIELIRQAMALIGGVIPSTDSPSRLQKARPCHQLFSPYTKNGAALVSGKTIRMVAVS